MDRGEALSIIDSYYNAHPELKTLLLKHSESVCRKALEILARPENSGLELDRHLVETGALLHREPSSYWHTERRTIQIWSHTPGSAAVIPAAG